MSKTNKKVLVIALFTLAIAMYGILTGSPYYPVAILFGCAGLTQLLFRDVIGRRMANSMAGSPTSQFGKPLYSATKSMALVAGAGLLLIAIGTLFPNLFPIQI